MRCPTLDELPPPPPGKTGWPWTIESPQLPENMPDGSPWPRISIVTPSYNQGQFIEETIRSVLLQGYQDLEYLILDGGSTDGAVDIIRKYEKWLTYWRSCSDDGQSASINEGFERCCGDICAWINSDDGYLPSALEHVAVAFADKHCEIVVGNSIYKDVEAAYYVKAMPIRNVYLTRPGHIPQHSTFWRSSIHEKIDVRINCAMDTELWLRLFPKAKKCARLSTALAFVNIHPNQKTSSREWDFARAGDQKIIEERHRRFWWGFKFINKLITLSLRLEASLDHIEDDIRDAKVIGKKMNFAHIFFERDPWAGKTNPLVF